MNNDSHAAVHTHSVMQRHYDAEVSSLQGSPLRTRESSCARAVSLETATSDYDAPQTTDATEEQAADLALHCDKEPGNAEAGATDDSVDCDCATPTLRVLQMRCA
jgi:hypothetical protein